MYSRQVLTASRRLPVLVFALGVLVAASIAGPTLPAWAVSSAYGTYEGKTSIHVYGLDGYIRASTTTALTGNEERVNLLNICGVPCDDFVQIGTYQGKNSTTSSYSAVHVFTENMSDGCSYYSLNDWGTLASANQAYYVNYDGGSNSGCGGTEYEFAFRSISYSHSPIAYGIMTVSHGQAEAGTELHIVGRTVPENNDYYGTDDSHDANGSNGLHVQTSASGAWNLWSSSQIDHTISDSPPTLSPITGPWAFSTGP